MGVEPSTDNSWALKISARRKRVVPCIRISRGLNALVLGTLAAVFWSLTLTISAIGEIAQGEFQWSLEGLLLAVLALAAVLSVAIAWRREKTGGIALVASGLAFITFGYLSAGHNKAFAMLISGGPFLVAGILFLASWWILRNPGTPG